MLKSADAPMTDNSNKGEPVKFLKGDTITIAGHDFTARIDSRTGYIISFDARGCNLITDPVKPCFWRVPTDNDEGGGDRSFASGWSKAGLDNFLSKANNLNISSQPDGSAVVDVVSTLSFVSGKTMTLNSKYVFHPDGTTDVNSTISLNGDFPPLARVGMEFAMPVKYSTVKWYGRGPFESYWDRKESCNVGIYSGSVADQHFPYVMPQETGNKTDVRWFSVTDKAETGLKIYGDKLLEVNVQDYSLAALNSSKTSHSLYRGNKTYVHVDLHQMGLGGDDSWNPRVHEQYRLTANSYTIGFSINPK
jgi:beta-galactosidase